MKLGLMKKVQFRLYFFAVHMGESLIRGCNRIFMSEINLNYILLTEANFGPKVVNKSLHNGRGLKARNFEKIKAGSR